MTEPARDSALGCGRRSWRPSVVVIGASPPTSEPMAPRSCHPASSWSGPEWPPTCSRWWTRIERRCEATPLAPIGQSRVRQSACSRSAIRWEPRRSAWPRPLGLARSSGHGVSSRYCSKPDRNWSVRTFRRSRSVLVAGELGSIRGWRPSNGGLPGRRSACSTPSVAGVGRLRSRGAPRWRGGARLLTGR